MRFALWRASGGVARGFLSWFAVLGFWSGASPLVARPVAAQGQPPREAGSAVLRYRDDLLGIRLTSAAAVHGRSIERARSAGSTSRRRWPTLGLPGVDRMAAGAGIAWFEREFPLAFAGPGTRMHAAESPLDAFFLAHLEPGVALERALAALSGLPEIEVAFPIAVVPALAVPDDSLWAGSYYFDQPSGRHIGAVSAWNVTTGDPSVVIAILDTGVIPYHPDLAEQIWTNPAEGAGQPGVDDDLNGFVDDRWGWDFVDLPAYVEIRTGEDGRDPDNDPNDFAGHGTAVAGVAAARSNNRIGVTGTAWNARILPLRVAWSTPLHPLGEGDISAMARAVRYATAMGASVINLSIATDDQPDFVAAVDDAIAAGVTIVTAAGNLGLIHYLAMREDVISVAATDENDRVASWSTTRAYVDLAAPGHRVSTTTVDRPGLDSLGLRQSTYTQGASGTSFSSPMVAGAVALIQSARLARGEPPLEPIEMLFRLTDTAHDINELNRDVAGFGSGRLDLDRALRQPTTSRRLRTRAVPSGPGLILPARDGPHRLAFATVDRRLLLLESTHGSIAREVALPGAPVGGLAAADLGGGFGFGLFVATKDGRIHGYGTDLEPLPGWPVVASVSWSAPFQREPALGDLDGDEILEVVWPGAGGSLWAWRADGRPMPGFPRTVANAELAIALCDLDGVQGVEIATVSALGRVAPFDGRGVPLPGNWPIELGRKSLPPVIATLGVPRRPILLCSTLYEMYAFERNGAVAWGASSEGGPALGSPALADFDGDGQDEVGQMRSAVMLVASDGHLRDEWLERAPLRGTISDDLLIVPLEQGGALAVVAAGGEQGLLAAGEDARRLGSFPKPGKARFSPMAADLDGNGSTDVVAVSADGWIYVYDAGPETWRDAPAWPMSRANAARTASRIGAPRIVPLDFTAPRRVADLAATFVDGRVDLTWTAPADDQGDAVTRYRMFRTTTRSGVTRSWVDTLTPAPPREPGASERFSTPVEENATVSFSIRSRDATGNWSEPSSPAVVEAPGRQPAAVTDLRVLETRGGTLVLGWTASGDDGSNGRLERYRLRVGETTLGEDWYDQAPLSFDLPAARDAGGLETFTIRGLRPGVRYRIALRAEDDRGNLSARSNLVSPWIGPLGTRVGAAIGAASQPARSPLRLYWQAPDGELPQRGEILVHDVAGRLVVKRALSGATEGVVDLDTGPVLGAGVYFATLKLDRAAITSKIVLAR